MPGAIPRPVMRGMHIRYAKRTLIEGFVAAGICGFLFKFFVMDPRKKKYAEFYKTYDPMVVENRMKEAGLLEAFPETFKEF